MATGFGTVITRLKGREPTEQTIAARLEDDHGVPQKSSGGLAAILVSSARTAELVSGDRFDTAAIEAAAAALPKTPEGPAKQPARPKAGTTGRTSTDPVPEATPAASPERPAPPLAAPEAGGAHPLASAMQVNVVVNVNASNLTPDEILQLVTALMKASDDPPQETKT
jgi:hypothetical protein